MLDQIVFDPSTPIMSAWILPAILGGATLLGSLFGSKTKKQESSSGMEESTSTPEYDPALWGARNTLLESYLDRLKGGQGWMTGYTGQSLRKINQAGDIKSKILSGILSARGLGSSPVAANLMGGLESERLGQQVDFLNQVPLLERQMQGEDMGALANYIASLPKGSKTSRTYSGQGTSYTQGRDLESGFQSAVANTILAKKYFG